MKLLARERLPSGPGAWFAPFVARLYLRRPELAGLIAIKYGSWRALSRAVWNEFLFQTKQTKGYRLISANFEVTNACNIACTICPVNHGMKRKRSRLDLATFERFLDRNPELLFVLLFQWGEPLLVKELPEMIAAASDRGVGTMITTNGTLLTEEWCNKLLDARLSRLTMSVDGDPVSHKEIRGIELEPIRQNLVRMRRLRDERGSDMGIDVSMVVNPRTEKCWPEVRASWAAIADRVQAIPQFMVKERANPCREPSRGTLVVLSDGSVTVCCSDPEGDETIGHVDDAPLQQMLNGERIQAFRRAHFNREFPALCADCGEFETDIAGARFER